MKFAGFVDEVSPELDIQIALTRELGWSGIEMRNVNVNGKTVHFDDVDDATFDKMYGMLQDAGISIISYGSQIANWSRKITGDFEKDRDELIRIIPRMKKTGTKLARVMSYPNDGWDTAVWRTEVLRRIKILAKIAEDGGIILAHENCSGYGNLNAEAAVDLVTSVNSPAFKLIHDTGNFWETGYDALEFYQATKAYVVHIHIKDYKKDPTNKYYVPCFPDEGEGRVKETVAVIRKSGYDGWYTMEPHITAVAHMGTQSTQTELNYDMFLKYGKMFESIYAAAR